MKNRARMKNLALVALVALAFHPDRADAQRVRSEARDSAGIRIIENERPPDGSRLGWRIGPEPSVSIGELEGDEPYMLHGAVDATRLPDGRIVVANAASHELRVFDGSGRHLATWGGRGEGPGEFTFLSQVAPWPGDSIVAWMSHGFGISVFDDDGKFGRSLSLQGDEWPRPLEARGNGTLLGMSGGERPDTALLGVWDGEGAPSGFLGKHASWEKITLNPGTRRGRTVTFAYGRRLVTGLWGDLFVASPTSGYEIRAFGGDGALARIVRRDHVPRAPTQADFDHYVEATLSERRVPEDRLEERRKDIRATPLAKTFPAFAAVMGDAAGHLWVREYDFPRETRPAALWTVFDREGRALGFVETPKDLEIYEIGEDYLLGLTMDDLGVESIQLWPLERVGG